MQVEHTDMVPCATSNSAVGKKENKVSKGEGQGMQDNVLAVSNTEFAVRESGLAIQKIGSVPPRQLSL